MSERTLTQTSCTCLLDTPETLPAFSNAGTLLIYACRRLPHSLILPGLSTATAGCCVISSLSVTCSDTYRLVTTDLTASVA